MTCLQTKIKEQLLSMLKKGVSIRFAPESTSYDTYAKRDNLSVNLVLVENEEEKWIDAIVHAELLLQEIEAEIKHDMEHPNFFKAIQSILKNEERTKAN